jgi:flagellin-like hook-associated protein FlgL
MAINDVSLTAGMRSNLVALQGTVDLLNRTQERLSTGKKVNTALDNPLNFFTAKALNSRAADLAGYKDGMSEAVQTIKAANAGISGIEGLLAQAKAVAATAKAGVEGGSGSYSNITVDLASVTNGQTINVGNQTFTAVATDGHLQKTINFGVMTAGQSITIGSTTFVATVSAGASTTQFTCTGVGTADAQSLLTLLGATAGTTSGSALTLNFTLSLGTVTTTVSATQANITSNTVALGTTEFFIGTGTSTAGSTDARTAANLTAKLNGFGEVAASATGARINILSGTITITSNTVVETAATITAVANQASTDRASYATQVGDIMNQLDLLATDSGYKGINFLAASNTLDVEFGSATGDKITLTSFDGSSTALLNKASVGSSFLKTAENSWATNDDVDVDIAALARATNTLKTEASRLSSGLSIINTRQDWVKGMVNTVTEGADKLTLADMNEEGANMLMLQTRQTLGTTALSLSAQAAQSVLRLFA